MPDWASMRAMHDSRLEPETEIDSDHPGFFRKSSSACTTRVAGVISTSPGVVLGNSFDASANRGDDNRPVLALAGRVLVKATTENGPISVGDLLVLPLSRAIPCAAATRLLP